MTPPRIDESNMNQLQLNFPSSIDKQSANLMIMELYTGTHLHTDCFKFSDTLRKESCDTI